MGLLFSMRAGYSRSLSCSLLSVFLRQDKTRQDVYLGIILPFFHRTIRQLRKLDVHIKSLEKMRGEGEGEGIRKTFQWYEILSKDFQSAHLFYNDEVSILLVNVVEGQVSNPRKT